MFDKLNKIEKVVFDVLAMALLLFYCYSAVLKPAATQYHRGIYCLITFVLVFLLYKSKNPILRAVDYLLILLSITTIGYWIINFEAINYRSGAETLTDQTIAVIGILIGIELARRVVGLSFVIIGCALLAYGVWGPYVPELFAHPGDTFVGLCTTCFYKSDGVFGIMANVLATLIFPWPPWGIVSAGPPKCPSWPAPFSGPYPAAPLPIRYPPGLSPFP